jgi:hypothetical protein
MNRGMVPNMIRRWGTVEGVASSSQFRVKLPIGTSYEKVELHLTNITHAQVTDLQVRINGGELMSFRSGTELELFNSYFDRDYVSRSGVLVVDFRRIGMKNPADRDVTILGTGVPASDPSEVVVSTLEIVGTLASGLTSPSIKSYAFMREAMPLGVLKQAKSFSFTPSGTGEIEISDVVRGRVIEAMAFDISSGVFDELAVEIDGNRVFEGPITMHNATQDNGVRDTQTDWFFLDLNPNGDSNSWLDVRAASDFRLKFNVTTAAAIPYTVFTLGRLTK